MSTEMAEVVWQEPPPRGGWLAQSKYNTLIEQLRGNPGEWGLLATVSSRSSAYTTASALRKRFPECEFTTRNQEIYGRTLPEGSA